METVSSGSRAFPPRSFAESSAAQKTILVRRTAMRKWPVFPREIKGLPAPIGLGCILRFLDFLYIDLGSGMSPTTPFTDDWRYEMIKDKFQIKLFFAPHELRVLRLAAASRNITPTTFLKEVGLLAAAKELEGFTPPTLETSPSPTRRKKTA